ncbi:MAG: UDP-N-acetylmuramoyl-L-alanyl-D-glutamate--2,6-diaminopimelate ligase [Desulfobaccales bacterium]
MPVAGTPTLGQLLEGLEGCRVRGDASLPVPGIAYHSREVVPGGMFVAIRGLTTDGRLYVPAALEQGARIVVSDRELSVPEGITLVQVPDARLALAHLSAAFYGHPSRELTLIGITGTNGKTTTAYLLEAILTAAGHRVGVLGTVNYRLGERRWPAPVTTPESLDLNRYLREMRQAEATHAVMEVSSHALDLKRVDRVAFDAAIFTNLSQDHLDYHRDLESYFQAKSRLFLEILGDGGPRGLAVLSVDDPWVRRLWPRVPGPVLTCGRHFEAQVRPVWTDFRQDGLTARLTTPWGELTLQSRLVGPFNLANILAATAAALGLGVAPEAVAAGVARLPGVPGRLERFGPPAGPHIFVDYAHTPDALASVLAALTTLGFGRIITVFGCGGDRDRSKRPLMGQAAAEASRLVIVTTDNPRTEDPLGIIADIEAGLAEAGLKPLSLAAICRGEPGYVVVPDRREAIRLAVRLAEPGEAVLVAGKGHEDYQIWGTRKIHFDDREEVCQALRERGWQPD